MSVFLSFVAVMWPVTYISVLLLRWFALEFIYNDPGVMWSGCAMTLIVGTVLLAIVTVVAWFMTRPFDEVVSKIKNEKYEVTSEDVKKCLASYKKLIILTVIAYIFGFFIGQIILVFIGIKFSGVEYIPSRVVSIVSQAVGFGFISLCATVNGIDKGLAKYRQMLKIRNLEEYSKYKTMNIAWKIFLLCGAIFYFVAVNMMIAQYGTMLELDNGTIPDAAIPLMFKRGIECLLWCLVMVAYPGYVLLRALGVRIRETANTVNRISKEGDLSGRIDIPFTDDFGILTGSFNTLMEKLSSMMKEMSHGTKAVSDSAEILNQSVSSATSAINNMTALLNEIQSNSKNQNELIFKADGSISELVTSVDTVKEQVIVQNDSMQQISSSITQMSANINSVANTAQRAQQVSEQLSSTSAIGSDAVEQAIQTMRDINSSFDELQSIVGSIQELSEKTNLLSMNAAIEAAHAGDVGKGFAVVADEVNSLATSSSESVTNIQKMLSSLMEKINAGVTAITAAGQAFSGIATKVQENAEMVGNIYAAMEEQRAGANDTQKFTLEILNSVQEVKGLAEKETRQAEALREFMQTVVDASLSTENAIQDSLAATTDLQQSITLVDGSASVNQKVVGKIQNQVAQFKL